MNQCKQYNVIYAKFTSLRDVHVSTLEEHKIEKEKNESQVCIKDANDRDDQVKDIFSTYKVLSCSKHVNNYCDNCSIFEMY